MRIGLFAHRIAQRHPTGIGRYLRELVSALSEVAGGQDDFVLASTREPESATWVPGTVRTHVVPWPRRSVQGMWCAGAGPRLERSLGHLDVAHLVTSFPPVKTAAPQLVTMHDVMPFEHPEWYPRLERWIFRRSAELVLHRARRIVVPSAYIADRLVSLLGVDTARIETVPHGVSGTFAGARSEQDSAATCARFGIEPGRFAVCVGWVATRKNLIPVIQALAELPGERLPLVLVGPDGHGAQDVDAEIARLDSRTRVFRTGFLSDEETAALVRGAAVLLHPSLGEGFGLVPLEAMAVRTPVIAARASSVPEVVGDAAVLVDEPTEPKAWADALTEVMGSGERRTELAAAGEQRAAAFSWERAARTMLEIYHDVARA